MEIQSSQSRIASNMNRTVGSVTTLSRLNNVVECINLPTTSSSNSGMKVLDAQIWFDLYASSAYCSSKTIVVQLLQGVSGYGSSTSGVSVYVTSDDYKHFQVMSFSTLIGRVVCLGLYNYNITTWPNAGQGLESFYYKTMRIMTIHFGHRVGKYDPSTELPRDFCARIGPLQLGVVLVPPPPPLLQTWDQTWS